MNQTANDDPSGRQRFLRGAWRLVPGRFRIASAFAALPAWTKGPFLARILGNLLEVTPIPRATRFRTNLGLPLPRTISIPAWAGPHALFGKLETVDGEATSVDACRSLLSLCDSFFDVGAHLGYYTWALGSENADRPTVAVEPAPELARLLRENARELGWQDRVEIIEAAVGAQAGRAVFHFNEEMPSMSTLVPEFVERYRHVDTEVTIVPLAELLRERGVQRALMKIDVEAAEWEVLDGLLPEARRARFIVMEVLEPAVQAGFLDHACSKLDMRVAHIEPDRLALEPPWGGGENARNWLFFRSIDTAEVASRLPLATTKSPQR